MDILTLDREEARKFDSRLSDFERAFRYPLGDDFFRIDHGDDYLAFFATLGEPHLFLAMQGDEIRGALVAVHRRFPKHAYYVGDLKVAAGQPGHFTGLQLIQAFERIARGAPTYGISMDPADGRNRLVELVQRSRRAGMSRACGLVFFSLGYDDWNASEDCLREAFGNLGWIDHRGRKDIVLESTRAPMPLLHLQHKPLGRAEVDGPRPGHIHMFCMPEDHPCAADLVARGQRVSAQASVLQRGLDDVDWSFVLTSDI